MASCINFQSEKKKVICEMLYLAISTAIVAELECSAPLIQKSLDVILIQFHLRIILKIYLLKIHLNVIFQSPFRLFHWKFS
jgi:hypothetical protein